MGDAPFHHEAVLYGDRPSWLASVVPFVEEGLEGREPVLVAAARDKLAALRKVVPPAPGLHLAPMEEMGRNPAWIVTAWAEFAAAHPGPVRGVAEPISKLHSTEELVECQRHEALLNLAFAERPGFRLLCPYDESVLPTAVIDEALRSHPWLGTSIASSAPSPAFDLADLWRYDLPLPEPPLGVTFEDVDVASLAAARRRAQVVAEVAGFSEARSQELALAVSELLTNSIRHAGGTGSYAVWTRAGTVVVEVRDTGRIEDPLAGRRRPPPEQIDGRGLWLIQQVCDLVQVRPLDGGGQVLRLTIRP